MIPRSFKTMLLAAACSLAGLPVMAAASETMVRLFAERTAMVRLDTQCRLFTAEERLGLTAFTAQARGALLRAGESDARVAGLERSARDAASRRACTEPVVATEAGRVRRAFQAWRTQMTAVYPGTVRNWQASRAGVDAWRSWQELGGGVRAGFLRTEAGAVFAVESPDTSIASARLFLRDPRRLGPPSAGGRLQVPLRAGTISHTAAARRAAVTKVRVEAAPRAGTLLVFADATTLAVSQADPRDSFEVELVSRTGAVRTVVVEVGDITAAWATAAVR